MTEIRHCKKCVEPDTRPGQVFDEAGVCLPCRYAETLDRIDWNARGRELDEIIAWARERSCSGYDCIIGVSGGKDSLRLALHARDELGLKPLLVCCSYPPEQQADRGAANLDNLVKLGFDLHFVSPGPATWKRMMQHGFETHAQWTRSTELALFTSMPRIAIAMWIPLVFLGENPALTFGTGVGSRDGNANAIRALNTLGGATLDPWIEAGIPRDHLFWYAFPSDEDIERLGLRMVYLGYYIRDFNDIVNGKIALERGLTPRLGEDADPADTGFINYYESVDEDFDIVNQYLKYLKLGFGKVTQEASVRVRLGEISREEAVELVRKYDGRCHQRYVSRYCRYLGITEERFWEVAERFRNRDLWQLNNKAEWEPRYKLR